MLRHTLELAPNAQGQASATGTATIASNVNNVTWLFSMRTTRRMSDVRDRGQMAANTTTPAPYQVLAGAVTSRSTAESGGESSGWLPTVLSNTGTLPGTGYIRT